MARRILLTSVLLACPLSAQNRVVTSVIPALAYGSGCSSVIHLRNLGDREVTVEVEGHRESGALVPLEGLAGETVQLGPHEQESYRLQIEEDTTSAWSRIREKIPSPELPPAIAISASTECQVGNQLRTAARRVTYPTRNPWFAGDVAEMSGNVVSLINTSEVAVRASACYSSGGLYSRASELLPICNAAVEVQVPPFGSREVPVSREGSSQFSLKTRGNGVVLEMLRPLAENLRIYAVDSSITFGSEATGDH